MVRKATEFWVLHMEAIPLGEHTPFIRCDFSDDVTWQSVREEVLKPNAELQEMFDLMMAANAHLERETGDVAGCIAYVDILDTPRFADLSLDELLQLVPPDFPHTFLFIFDQVTASHAEHPILVVDLYHERGRTFRALPNQIQAIENNLSIANMDWEDFAGSLDSDGIYRGFEDSA
jgi:uncharacterized protein DUF6924